MALPWSFMRGPGPDVAVQRIDFAKLGLSEYKDHYAVTLDCVLTLEECRMLLKAAEASAGGTWERALINVGGGRQKLLEDVRNCGRIIWDSGDVVGRIWSRIEHLPDIQDIMALSERPLICGNGPTKRKERWVFTRPNERMRFLKYVGGEYFKPHCDGSYETPDGTERSYFTLHLYLNDAEEVSGGATSFHSLRQDIANAGEMNDFHVMPKPGRILIFQHRNLVHSGADVEKGTKFTMRTDLMYRRESARSCTKSSVEKPDW